MSNSSSHSPPPTFKNNYPRFVLHTTETSIEKDQFSILALFESLGAFIGYLTVILFFDLQWWWSLFLITAPLLLLRSPASIEKGLNRLQTYAKQDIDHFSTLPKLLIFLFALASSFSLMSWVAPDWLANRQDWDLFWGAALFGVFIFAIGFVGALLVASLFAQIKIESHAIEHLLVTVGAVVFAVTVIFAGAFAGSAKFLFAVAFAVTSAFVVISAVAMAFAIVRIPDDKLILNSIRWLMYPLRSLFYLSTASGFLGRSLWIRITTSLQHPLQGLSKLLDNWQTLMWKQDFLYSPELLPKASKVDSRYAAKGLINSFISAKRKHWHHFPICLLFYFTAIFWRWTLKATLFLWLPLFLLLRSPFKAQSFAELDKKMPPHIKQTCLVSWFIWLLALCWVLLPHSLLLTGLFESFLKGVFTNDVATQVLSIFVFPTESLRMILLCLLLSLSVVIWFYVKNLNGLYKATQKTEMGLIHSKIKQVEWVYRIQVLVMILFGYSLVVFAAHHFFPSTVEPFIHTVLLKML